MIRLVPDTSSLIRGFTSYLNPQRQIINLAVSNKISLIGSSETRNEFAQKIKLERFNRFLQPKLLTSEIILNNYGNLITLIEPDEQYAHLKVCRDPEDDIFIQVALSVGAQIIISEDKDLLDIKKYDNIRIIKAETFMNAYSKK